MVRVCVSVKVGARVRVGVGLVRGKFGLSRAQSFP